MMAELNSNFITCNRCGYMLKTVDQAVLHSLECYQQQQHPILAAIKAADLLASSSSSTNSGEQPVNLTAKNKQLVVSDDEAVDFRTPSVVNKQKLALTTYESNVDNNNNNNNGETTLSLEPCRKHVCEFCQKAFHQKRTLVAHRRIHTGEKPYKCPICDAAFTQATHRNGHVKTHDPDFRPYSCSICGRCFARKYSLTMHNYIHQGIFPFKCSFCEKKFRQAADMRKHEQRHVVHFSLLCRRCHLKFPSKTALDRHIPICSKNIITPSS